MPVSRRAARVDSRPHAGPGRLGQTRTYPAASAVEAMQVVLLRVGIDTGSGGIHGPLFRDGSFEYIPIWDRFGGRGVDERTYGNTLSRKGLKETTDCRRL